MEGRRLRRLATSLALVATVMAGCGGGGGVGGTQSSSAQAGGFDVRSENLVDQASRAIETTVYVPRGRAGPSPLIVFIHGSGGNPDFYKVLLEAWAGAGYVVAAPRLTVPVPEQPAEVSAVIDQLVRSGVVDAQRIGVAGHSAGAETVLGIGFNTCCIDPRVRAGAVLAGDAPPIPGGTYFTGIHTPLLVVHAVADPTVPFADGRRAFTDALAPKIMLTVPPSDTPSADHARPYVGTENRPLRDTQVVMATTIAFFDRYLRDDRDAIARMRAAVDAEVDFKLDVVEA